MRHTIRHQTLDIDVDSETLALALQPNIGDVNRRRFLPVIERVFDEFSRPDRRIRIAKLDVDIGDLPFANFEQAAEDALYAALRHALEQALRDVSEGSSADMRPETLSQLEILEHYLSGGTLQSWASGESFSAEALVLELSRNDPAGLAAMIRRHAGDRRFVERLVLQLSGAALEQLLHLLTPEHAALILAYMLDLRRVHRVESLLTLHDDRFADLLWVVVLSYVLRDPGSQFNRKSFLHWLLINVAESESLDYADLVKTLQHGLHETEKHQSLTSSLPAVLDELLSEITAKETPDDELGKQGQASEPTRDSLPQGFIHGEVIPRLASLEQFLLGGTWPSLESRGWARSVEDRVLELLQSDPDGLRELIRVQGPDRDFIERLVDRLNEATLQRILDLLNSEHASPIIAYLADIKQVHRVTPLVSLSDNQFARLLWGLALDYVLREPGSQFNRKSFVLSLLKGMAESKGLDLVDLTETLRLGLLANEAAHPSVSSLSAILREVAQDLGSSSIDLAEDAHRETDIWVVLESYLSTGRTPSGPVESSDISFDVRDLFFRAVAEDTARVAHLIRRLSRASEKRRLTVVGRLLHHLAAGEVLALLKPEYQTAIAKLVEDASQYLGPDDARPKIQGVLWTAALEYLLGQFASVPDLEAMGHHIIAAAAARIGSDSNSSDRVRHSSGDDRRDDAPLFKMLPRAFKHYDEAEILHYYLRHGVLPWPALLLDADLTVEGTLAPLLRLSPGVFREVFAQARREKHEIFALRIVNELPEHAILELLSRLLPMATAADSPFRSALATFAHQATDRKVFYSRVIAAALGGSALDLEKFVASDLMQMPVIEPILAADLSRSEAHTLKSALAGRLRFGEAFLPDAPATAALLQALAGRHAEDTRNFMQAIGEQQELRAALVREVPTSALHAVVEQIYRAEAEVLLEISRVLAKLSPADRRDADEIRGELFLEGVLRLAANRPLTADFFLRLFLSFFSLPLSDQVREELSRHVTLWRNAGGLLATQIDALDLAIANTSRDRGDMPDDRADAARPAVSFLPQEAVLAFLRGDNSAPDAARITDTPGSGTLSDDTLVYALRRMLDDGAEDIADFVRQNAADQQQRERWIKVLPGSILARLSYLIEPRQYRTLLAAAEILAAAWQEAAPQGRGSATIHEQLWGFLFDFLVEHPSSDRTVDQLVADFIVRSTAIEGDSGARLLEHADRLARAAGHAQLITILDHERLRVSSQPQVPNKAARPATKARKAREEGRSRPVGQKNNQIKLKTAFSLVEEDEVKTGEPIYIGNAGLILTSAFLPHLFQQLGLLGEDDKGRPHLRDRDAVSRAVHLLQYLVDGRTSAPEPLLVLNKILCGVPTQIPVSREIEPTDDERKLCDFLLRSMIANWKTIADTSVAGLRETFLQREGKLQRVDDGWKLRVQRKTVDVLVDQVPWSISVVLHPWMPEPIHVNW